MVNGTKPLSEKENTIQEFTVMFWNSKVIIEKEAIPLGLISTEVLNYPDEKLSELQALSASALEFICDELYNPNTKKDIIFANRVQDKLNEVLDCIFELPLFNRLNLDLDLAKSLIPTTFNRFPEEFEQLIKPKTLENQIFTEYLFKLGYLPEELHSFKTYVSVLLDFYFERLKLRNSQYYAIGLYDFFGNTQLQQEIAASLPPSPFQIFHQTCGAMIEFTTMPNPDNIKDYIIAERTVFNRLGEFLHVDFFRGLMHGHTPRRCKNCGNFFLLSDGYSTIYCNQIAPGETTKTCQKVGAHRTAARGENKTPERKLYDLVYNRLKARHQRKTLSDDEWNKAVAQAWEYKEQAESGKLQYYELEELYKKM